MKTKLLSTILLVFVALNMNAQSPNWQWALRAGGTSTEYAESTLDANGNIYVSGAFFSPTITFGTTTLSNAGGADMFIANTMPRAMFFGRKVQGELLLMLHKTLRQMLTVMYT